ncbi:MAG: hypothetical protein JNL05_04200 [Flavobacteriales bacterium]|nr:hypothetical protein [Flavobacteriales bacterium]
MAQDRTTIRLADAQGYVDATVSGNDKLPAEPDPQVVYHWYRAQRVQATAGGAAGRLLDGPYRAFHPDGQLREQGVFEDGMRTGEWRQWNAAGELQAVVHWKHGSLHGDSVAYAGGIMLHRVSYRHGERGKVHPGEVELARQAEVKAQEREARRSKQQEDRKAHQAERAARKQERRKARAAGKERTKEPRPAKPHAGQEAPAP